MANEITKLDGDGGLNAKLIFLYSITAPTYQGNAGEQTVVVTPAAELPVLAVAILSATEKSALNDGSKAFEVVTMKVEDAKSNATLLAEARALYTKRKADFVERLNRKYNRAGQRFNEV